MYADTNNVFGCESKYFEYLHRELKCEKYIIWACGKLFHCFLPSVVFVG